MKYEPKTVGTISRQVSVVKIRQTGGDTIETCSGSKKKAKRLGKEKQQIESISMGIEALQIRKEEVTKSMPAFKDKRENGGVGSSTKGRGEPRKKRAECYARSSVDCHSHYSRETQLATKGIEEKAQGSENS